MLVLRSNDTGTKVRIKMQLRQASIAAHEIILFPYVIIVYSSNVNQ